MCEEVNSVRNSETVSINEHCVWTVKACIGHGIVNELTGWNWIMFGFCNWIELKHLGSWCIWKILSRPRLVLLSRPRLALMSRSRPVLMSIDVKANVSIHLYGATLTLYKITLKKRHKNKQRKQQHVLDTTAYSVYYIILTVNIIYRECFGERWKDRRYSLDSRMRCNCN